MIGLIVDFNGYRNRLLNKQRFHYHKQTDIFFGFWLDGRLLVSSHCSNNLLIWRSTVI